MVDQTTSFVNALALMLLVTAGFASVRDDLRITKPSNRPPLIRWLPPKPLDPKPARHLNLLPSIRQSRATCPGSSFTRGRHYSIYRSTHAGEPGGTGSS